LSPLFLAVHQRHNQLEACPRESVKMQSTTDSQTQTDEATRLLRRVEKARSCACVQQLDCDADGGRTASAGWKRNQRPVAGGAVSPEARLNLRGGRDQFSSYKAVKEVNEEASRQGQAEHSTSALWRYGVMREIELAKERRPATLYP